MPQYVVCPFVSLSVCEKVKKTNAVVDEIRRKVDPKGWVMHIETSD